MKAQIYHSDALIRIFGDHDEVIADLPLERFDESGWGPRAMTSKVRKNANSALNKMKLVMLTRWQRQEWGWQAVVDHRPRL